MDDLTPIVYLRLGGVCVVLLLHRLVSNVALFYDLMTFSSLGEGDVGGFGDQRAPADGSFLGRLLQGLVEE